MPAAPTHTPPHVQLRELAALALRRGLSFDEFWIEAVRPGKALVKMTHPNPPPGAVRWPTDYHDRQTWRAAILETEDGWRRIYEGQPLLPRHRAITVLMEELGMDALGEPPVGIAA